MNYVPRSRLPREISPSLIGFNVSGVNSLIKKLEKINKSDARRAVHSGMKKGMKVIVKAMKSEVPHPSVRYTISSRFQIHRPGTRHRTMAKVGASVGPRKTWKFGKSGGSHISKYNAHWYFLGTVERFHKSGASTGRMPQHFGITDGYRKSKSRAEAVMKREVKRVFEKLFSKR